MSVYFLAVGEVFRENVEGPHQGSRSKRPIHTEPVVLIVQDVSVNKILKNRQSLHFNENKLQTPVQRTVKMEPISFREKVYKDCRKHITFKQLPFPIFQCNNELNMHINWWFVTELLNLHLQDVEFDTETRAYLRSPFSLFKF